LRGTDCQTFTEKIGSVFWRLTKDIILKAIGKFSDDLPFLQKNPLLIPLLPVTRSKGTHQ